MPPARAKGKAKAKAVAQAQQQPQHVGTNANTPVYVDIERKKSAIKAHPLMTNIEEESVLTIAEGGRMAPFDARAFKTCMENNQKYLCGGNFFWQNVMVSPTPSVTIIKKNIEDVGQLNYPETMRPVPLIPHTISIGIPTTDFDPKAHAGSLTRISPCEYVLAAIDRCFMAVDAGADDDTILSWQKAFRSTTFSFKARARRIHVEAALAQPVLGPRTAWPKLGWASAGLGVGLGRPRS